MPASQAVHASYQHYGWQYDLCWAVHHPQHHHRLLLLLLLLLC
jgi:hypothetical protein